MLRGVRGGPERLYRELVVAYRVTTLRAQASFTRRVPPNGAEVISRYSDVQRWTWSSVVTTTVLHPTSVTRPTNAGSKRLPPPAARHACYHCRYCNTSRYAPANWSCIPTTWYRTACSCTRLSAPAPTVFSGPLQARLRPALRKGVLRGCRSDPTAATRYAAA